MVPLRGSVLPLVALGLALLCPSLVLAADPPKDTPAAAFTRTKKLKGKITVEFKDEMLKEVFKEISGQLEDSKLGALSVHYSTGISGNTKVSYSGKEVPLEVALDAILKQLDLGYIVVSKEKDRYDGWLEIVKGNERGYPLSASAASKTPDPKKGPPAKKPDAKAPEPKKEEMKKDDPKKDDTKKEEGKKDEPKKVTAEDEQQATQKLELAKKLQAEGKTDRAKVQLKFILRYYNGTKAATEAKELLEKLNQ